MALAPGPSGVHRETAEVIVYPGSQVCSSSTADHLASTPEQDRVIDDIDYWTHERDGGRSHTTGLRRHPASLRPQVRTKDGRGDLVAATLLSEDSALHGACDGGRG